MASKFTKFLTFTTLIGAATIAGVALYKKYKDDNSLIDEDFDDFDDLDDFEDEDDMLDGDDTVRGYTSLTSDDDDENMDDFEELQASLADALEDDDEDEDNYIPSDLEAKVAEVLAEDSEDTLTEEEKAALSDKPDGYLF